MISSSQRPLPDNTRHSQQTNIHAPGGIRTHDISKWAAADPRLRPRAHWDRLGRRTYLCKILAFNLVMYGKYISELHEGLYLISPNSAQQYELTVAQKANNIYSLPPFPWNQQVRYRGHKSPRQHILRYVGSVRSLPVGWQLSDFHITSRMLHTQPI